MDDLFCSVVPGQSAGASECQCRGTGVAHGERAEHRGPWECAVAKARRESNGVAAGRAIFLPELRLVFLCDVAADVSQGRARFGNHLECRDEMAGRFAEGAFSPE